MNLFLLLLAFSVGGPETPYQPVNNISWQGCSKSSVEPSDGTNIYPLTYTYCTSQGDISHQFIEWALKEYSEDVFLYIEFLGLNKKESRSNTNLDVYEVDMGTLNDKSRFYKWQTQDNAGQKIWALYDARYDAISTSSIILTHHPEWDEVLFGHELAHYWYDRFSLDLVFSTKTEEFAINFETYLSSKRGL